MNTFLVTGAAGFVGSNLTRLLVESGENVRGLVRNQKQADIVAALGATPVIGDLRDPESLKRAVEGVQGVYHIAALFRQAGVPDSLYTEVNVEGTRNLIEASIEGGVKRFIHCSTVGVHGHVMNPPANEESPFNPGDLYQDSKARGEKLVREYFDQKKIDGVIIRPAMIYGPGDERTLKLFKMLANKKFFYVGKGAAMVHFIDVRDLARAFKLAMDQTEVNNERFIIAGETSLPLYKLVSIVCQMMGVPEPSLHLPVKPVQLLGTICETVCKPFNINPPIYRRRVDFFTKDRNFDCSKAITKLGFKPAQDLKGELKDILDSYISAGLIECPNIPLAA